MDQKDKPKKYPFDDDIEDTSSDGGSPTFAKPTSFRQDESEEEEASSMSSSFTKPKINKKTVLNKSQSKKEPRVTFKEHSDEDFWSEESSPLSEKTSPISHSNRKEATRSVDKGTQSNKTTSNLKKNKTQDDLKSKSLVDENTTSSKKKKKIKTNEDDEESLLRAFVEFDSSSGSESEEEDAKGSKQVSRKVISYNSQGLPPQDSSLRTRFRDIEDDNEVLESSRNGNESRRGDYFYESDEDTRHGPTKVFSFTSGQRSRMSFHRKRIMQYNQKYNGFGNLMSPFVRIVDDSVQNHTGPVKYFCLMCGAPPNRFLLKETVHHLRNKCPRTLVQESESTEVDNDLTILAEHYDNYVDQANRRIRIQQDAAKLAEVKARRAYLLNRTTEFITESNMEKSVKSFQAIHSLLRKVMVLKTQMGLRGKDVEAISAASLSKRMRKYEVEDEETDAEI